MDEDGDGRWRESIYMSAAVARQVMDDLAEQQRAKAAACECGGVVRWERDVGERLWVGCCGSCGRRKLGPDDDAD